MDGILFSHLESSIWHKYGECTSTLRYDHITTDFYPSIHQSFSSCSFLDTSTSELIFSFTYAFLVQRDDQPYDQKAYYYLEKAADQVHFLKPEIH